MSEAAPVWARDHDEDRAAPATPDAATAPAADAAAAAPAASGAAAEPEPLGVTVAVTGNADVDAAVERLGDADELPVSDHIQVYEDVHAGLRNALAALDENRG